MQSKSNPPGRSTPPTLRILVPASTSNLGPGFDFLGLALSLFLEVRVLGSANGDTHELTQLEGTASAWPVGASNHFLRAFDLAATRLGLRAGPMRFSVRSEIPVARGLGSSGAAVVAGLRLACAMTEKPASPDQLLAWGLELEGHPDNSSAALLGGCTLSVPLPDGSVRVVRQPLHADLAFAVAWPSRGFATHDARAVLPKLVSFADAVENPRRLALLLEGLRSADPELLGLGGEDRLHVPYRLPKIEGAAAAMEAARASGAWLATISGSGSGLVAIGPHARIKEIAAQMRRALQTGDPAAESRVVTPA